MAYMPNPSLRLWGTSVPTSSSMPEEWLKANEALKQVQTKKDDDSTSTGSATTVNSTTVTTSASSQPQPNNIVNYPYSAYWPHMFPYHASYPGYQPNYAYCQMDYRNGYVPYQFYGMQQVPAAAASSNSLAQNELSSSECSPSTSAGPSPQKSDVAVPTDVEVTFLASQPPPPPPPPPTPPAPPDDSESAEESRSFPVRPKQAPGITGIKFSMPVNRMQKVNTLRNFDKKMKNKAKVKTLAQKYLPFSKFEDLSDTEQSDERIRPFDDDNDIQFLAVGSGHPDEIDHQESERMPDQNEWPPSLKKYITESFQRCKTQAEQDQLEIMIKATMRKAYEDRTLWKKDWSKEPFIRPHGISVKKEPYEKPSITSRLSLPNRTRMPGYKEKEEFHTHFRRHRYFSRSRSRSGSRSPARSRSRSGSPSAKCTKRKRNSSDSNSSHSSTEGPSHVKKQTISSSVGQYESLTIYGNKAGWNNAHSTKKKKKKNKKNTPFTVDPEFCTNDRLQRRAARFETSSDKKVSLVLTINNPSICIDEEDIDWSNYTIIGTSQDIEKPYLRLTGAVDPSSIRPENVLDKSLEMVRNHWIKNQDYHYACEQLKSIRQDLVVQCIRNEFTVLAYETHARIALEKGDHTEFNQCQSQLRVLYEELGGPNKLEFLGYRILYNMYTNDTRELKNILASLSDEEKQNKVVSHALSLNSARTLNNFHVFFKLYITAPAMSGYLIDWFVPAVRKVALKAIVKSFRPTLPVAFVHTALAFTSLEETLNLLEEVKCVLSDDKKEIRCKESSSVVT